MTFCIMGLSAWAGKQQNQENNVQKEGEDEQLQLIASLRNAEIIPLLIDCN